MDKITWFNKLKPFMSNIVFFYDWRLGRGLEYIEFVGFIEIGDNFLKKIQKEYQWKSTKKSKKISPKSTLTEGDNENYEFVYNYEFSHDGNYKSHSALGNFYLDVEKKLLYFEVEYS